TPTPMLQPTPWSPPAIAAAASADCQHRRAGSHRKGLGKATGPHPCLPVTSTELLNLRPSLGRSTSPGGVGRRTGRPASSPRTSLRQRELRSCRAAIGCASWSRRREGGRVRSLGPPPPAGPAPPSRAGFFLAGLISGAG